MKVMFVGKKTEKLEFANVANAKELKLAIKVNVAITAPTKPKEGLNIIVRHTAMFGSPVDPFYFLIRHATQYQITEDADIVEADQETARRIMNEACTPLALVKFNETLEAICKGLEIGKLQIQPAKKEEEKQSDGPVWGPDGDMTS